MAKSTSQTANRALVVRALTDPKFRKQLETAPERALGIRLIDAVKKKEIQIVLAIVKGIDRQIAGLADELLCANGGGGCGIA